MTTLQTPTALVRAYELLAALQHPDSPAEWDLAETDAGWLAQRIDKSSGDILESLGPCKTPVAAAGAALDYEQTRDHDAQAAKIQALDRAYLDACRELRLYVAANRHRQGEPAVVRRTAELDRAARAAAERLLDAMRGE